MIWVGLTGGIASGKSTVGKILQGFGFTVIDADVLARQAVSLGSKGLAEIVLEFGPGVLNPTGELDRKKMADLVFAKPEAKKNLEAIVHPYVQAAVQQARAQAEQRGEAVAFYDVPLLFENNLEASFDSVLVVGSPETVQIERMQKRNQLSETQALARLQAQMPLQYKKSRASFYIENNGSLESLKDQVLAYLASLKEPVVKRLD